MRFFTRLVLFLMKIILPFYYIGAKKANGMACLSFKNGVTFEARVKTQDAMVLNEVWKHSCYERAPVAFGDVVVDIGAHIGGYTVLVAKKGATVFSYEPELGNYSLLTRNVVANNCQSVKLYNRAVSSGKGTVILNVDIKGTGLHSLYQSTSACKKTEVASVSLHDVITMNHLKKIQVLKIDTEGAEYDILLPARSSDLAKIQTVILEYHDYFNHSHNKNELEVLLRNNGFTVQDISPWYQQFLMKSGILLATRSRNVQSG